MRIAYVGNYTASWCTEVHVAASFELNGHQVLRIQEAEHVWQTVPQQAAAFDAELIVWTRTYGLDRDLDAQRAGLTQTKNMGIATATIHLDKWFDLPRADQLPSEPHFRCDYVFTADGGHQDDFAALDINHYWLPPAVYEPECVKGRPHRSMRRDVAFVGSWAGGYHPEWTHRSELIAHLKRWYGTRLGLWPRGRQVRGQELADLYASVKVVVGDSCLLGANGRYWSDRIPETLGRAGFLLHPNVIGLSDYYTPGEHFDTWTLGDWDELHAKLEHYLAADDEREQIRHAGFEHVKAHHTYTQRTAEMLNVITRDRERVDA